MRFAVPIKTILIFSIIFLSTSYAQTQGLFDKVKSKYNKGKDIVEKTDKAIDELTGTGSKAKTKQPTTPTISQGNNTKKTENPGDEQTLRTSSVQPVQPTGSANGCTALSFHPGIAVSVDSCVGNKTSQTATVYFNVRHQLPHQSLSMSIASNTQAYDSEGNIRNAESGSIGGRRETYSVTDRIPTGVKIPCTITFSNIVDFKNPSLQSVFIQCYAAEANGGGNAVQGQIEISNLPIKWQ